MEVRLVRCAEGRVSLRSAELTRFTDRGEQVGDTDAYRRLAAEAFGLPNLPIDQAIMFLINRRQD